MLISLIKRTCVRTHWESDGRLQRVPDTAVNLLTGYPVVVVCDDVSSRWRRRRVATRVSSQLPESMQHHTVSLPFQSVISNCDSPITVRRYQFLSASLYFSKRGAY